MNVIALLSQIFLAHPFTGPVEHFQIKWGQAYDIWWPWYPQILADQLTISQPRGVDYAQKITLFRRA